MIKNYRVYKSCLGHCMKSPLPWGLRILWYAFIQRAVSFQVKFFSLTNRRVELFPFGVLWTS